MLLLAPQSFWTRRANFENSDYRKHLLILNYIGQVAMEGASEDEEQHMEEPLRRADASTPLNRAPGTSNFNLSSQPSIRSIDGGMEVIFNEKKSELIKKELMPIFAPSWVMGLEMLGHSIQPLGLENCINGNVYKFNRGFIQVFSHFLFKRIAMLEKTCRYNFHI